MERWRAIDRASPEDARAHLRVCCGSDRWIERMLARRPFVSRDQAVRAAREEWFALDTGDWKEAFAHHPRIGDLEALRERLGATAALSAREQAGVDAAPGDVLQALLEGNRAYEARFGFIYIVFASGKSAREMLDLLRTRLTNAPGDEIRVAAGEHARICERRLLAEV